MYSTCAGFNNLQSSVKDHKTTLKIVYGGSMCTWAVWVCVHFLWDSTTIQKWNFHQVIIKRKDGFNEPLINNIIYPYTLILVSYTEIHHCQNVVIMKILSRKNGLFKSSPQPLFWHPRKHTAPWASYKPSFCVNTLYLDLMFCLFCIG